MKILVGCSLLIVFVAVYSATFAWALFGKGLAFEASLCSALAVACAVMVAPLLRAIYLAAVTGLSLKSPVYKLAVGLSLIGLVSLFAAAQVHWMNAYVLSNDRSGDRMVPEYDPEIRGS